MSMYVEVLSGALEGWDARLAGEELLQYVVACRAVLPIHALGAGGMAEASLAAEVAYDRALIHLAAVHGIDVAPTNFCHPAIARQRLEMELTSLGIDLDHAPPHGHEDEASDVADSGDGSPERCVSPPT
jgi:hypothetical protein